MSQFTTRPSILCQNGAITSGHYLASSAGLRILQQGGNAIDAAAAAVFCCNLLEPHLNGLGGECPTLIYSAKHRKTFALSGQGFSPAALTIDWCRDHNIDLIPGDGYLPACVPATLDTWTLALTRFGTMSLSQVLAPAIELAESGYPVYPGLHNALKNVHAHVAARYPTTAKLYYPKGKTPNVGEVIKNPGFAACLRSLCAAERRAKRKGRAAALRAARDFFYKGPIARRIVSFIRDHPVLDASGRQHAGLLELDDFFQWHAEIETPVSLNFAGLTVHKCPPWTQGPVFLQQLALLEGLDLLSLGHNSAAYLHAWIESAKLAFADREAYYGDPDFDRVPLKTLLSKPYAAHRRALIGPSASMEMRPGAINGRNPDYATHFDIRDINRPAGFNSANPMANDTTHVDAADADGNLVSATPSGGWLQTSPMIEGLGLCLGTRGQMFYLNPNRPNALQPHKRPRATLTPTIATRTGKPHMAFGTPGGDSQDQTSLQFFLNNVVFGMPLQEALEAPYVVSEHFPSSFYPREAAPGKVLAETRIPPEVLDQLTQRGHGITPVGDWHPGSTVMAVRFDPHRGLIEAGCSPRRATGYAVGH